VGDLSWLEGVERLTMWAVELPATLLRQLPRLWWLDIRGGSASDVTFLQGCSGLRYLRLNQIRGVDQVESIAELERLEFLSLYGLPRLRSFPRLGALRELRRVELGSLKGLEGIAGLLDAPGIEELLLMKMVRLGASDVELLALYTPLKAFYWFAEDVPDRLWVPLRDRLGLPPARTLYPEEWFRARGIPVS
jgi:hypothetical protein